MKKIILGALVIGLSFSSCTTEERVGAVCEDGWHSSATGSGACSHHGGVDYWIYKEQK